MLAKTIIVILCEIQFIVSSYLDENYGSSRVERTNIVNKGVWVRNFKEHDKTGNFLFRGNSVDVDNIVQGDFNGAFGDGGLQNSPFISSYVERSKREVDNRRNKRIRKSVSNCKGKSCNTNTIEDNPSLVKSKLITKLKPASVFNDYPYEIAILLSNSKDALNEAKNYSTYVINEMVKDDNQSVIPLTEKNNTIYKIEDIVTDFNKTNVTLVPKRSMNNYESEVIQNVALKEHVKDNVNNTLGTPRSFLSRDVFAKEDKAWHQNAPVPETHKYNVIGKSEEPKAAKPVTERGLMKLLSMLTSTFKKIMKQHSDIKEIHTKLNSMNEGFVKNLEVISDKLQDFESKYATFVSLSQKITDMDKKLNIKEQHFKSKESELSKNLVEFEVQQKKFLTQQRQFYNIQKLMLAQNERINSKQNAIAKTQSEISHRQNNFARILKKAKQIYIDNKHHIHQPTTAYPKLESNNKNKMTLDETIIQTSTRKPDVSTEPVKINLFSIPVVPKIKNQDHILLNEKDEHPVDDLVYKYYFNNTFIDSLMKNFLSGFISTAESNDNIRNVKNKRNEVSDKTTVLLPVKKSSIDVMEGNVLKRDRRWINHHSRKKSRRKNRGKGASEKVDVDDEKPTKNAKPVDNLYESEPFKTLGPMSDRNTNDIQKSDAFISMATGFCNGIGQNSTPQVLSWCIEKALRRLQNIDVKIPTPPPTENPEETNKKEIIPQRIIEYREESTTAAPTIKSESSSSTQHIFVTTKMEPATILPSTYTPVSTMLVATDNYDLFFPDNDKLESNLKQFETTADKEGNVYYDGSLHASDVLNDDQNSESDILPGLDSNSRIDTIDPSTFDTHAMRRAFIRSIAEVRRAANRSVDKNTMKYESKLKKTKKL